MENRPVIAKGWGEDKGRRKAGAALKRVTGETLVVLELFCVLTASYTLL